MDASARSPRVAPIAFPPGRQFAVTWGIPDPYGGMTAAMLHRSRAIVEMTGIPVEILTFDPEPDVDGIRDRLRESGELIDGMLLRNVFEDLRLVDRPPMPVPTPPAQVDPRGGQEIAVPQTLRRRVGPDGETVRVEHRRRDGSLALLDEKRRRSGPQRLLTSFDASGTPTGQWTSASALYFDWLDDVRGGDRATMVVDSKTVARFLRRYRRDDVVSIYRVHGSHRPSDGSEGLDVTRRDVFENLHEWDAVALLTERQRHDVAELLGDTGNLAVAPNPVTPPGRIARLAPDPLHGVIVSRMSRLKRLDHALRIVAKVRALGIPVTVDIIGDGSQRARLEELARTLGIGGAVRFEGHLPHAADRFESAAWTLLTSRSEGGSLTLVEAMAAGCIPLSYDIPYGPADVIEHGVNGWIVSDGDTTGAARLLAHQCTLDDDEAAALRRAARRTARRQDEAGVIAQWAAVQWGASRRHDARIAAPELLDRVRVRHLRGRHLVTAKAAPSVVSAPVEVRLMRSDGTAVRARARRLGPFRSARLSRADSAVLGDGGVRTLFLVTTADGVVTIDAGVRHPDPRGLTRRVAARVRRLIDRGRGASPQPAAG